MSGKYGEPWRECDAGIELPDGRWIASTPFDDVRDRIVACVNKLAAFPSLDDCVVMNRAEVPDSDKLRLIADWFDANQHRFPAWGDDREVQRDLRKWADALDAARKGGG